MWGKVVAVILVLFALGFQPLLTCIKGLSKAPMDPKIGKLDILPPDELATFYTNRRTLVVGGTRGVGRGIARAIAVAGGHVTVVGRSAVSGASAVAHIKASAKSPTQQITFLAGDLGTMRTAKALVRSLTELAEKEGRFDYMVVTAAVFPDWKEMLQEDGLEKGHAIAVVGRYMLYRHMDLFLKEGARVLNVAAAGEQHANFDKELLTGQRNATSLWEAVLNWAGIVEMVQIGIQESGDFHKTTRVSTHPGLLSTELHVGQGWIMDMAEPVLVGLMGISEDDCGLRQASILASPRLHKENLTLVDEDMIGRLHSTGFQTNVGKHLPWVMSWLNERVQL